MGIAPSRSIPLREPLAAFMVTKVTGQRKMSCIKCRLRKWYYILLKYLMFPVRTLAGRINIEDQVTATLIKDGKVIKRIVGIKMHNKWKSGSEEGLEEMVNLLWQGGAGTQPCKVVNMLLGSQCSDTGWTVIGGTTDPTSNSKVSNTQVKFVGEWVESGAINNICQAMIQMYGFTGDVYTRDAAIYNFGTAFNKPDGVALKIEWTTTLSS